jgi:hypothetical protein
MTIHFVKEIKTKKTSINILHFIMSRKMKVLNFKVDCGGVRNVHTTKTNFLVISSTLLFDRALVYAVKQGSEWDESPIGWNEFLLP